MSSSKSSVPIDLQSRRISRRRALAFILIPSLLTFSLLIPRHQTHHISLANSHPSSTLRVLLDHISPDSTSFKQLVALSDSQRAHALAHALNEWRSGPLPPAVSVAAAVCTTRDAVDAILRGDLSQTIVIDVGAQKGYPVTTTALQRLVRVVVSVEPDPAAFPTLASLRVSKNNIFAPLNAALSEPDAHGQIILPALQLNATCSDCPVPSIPVSTVDSLILDGHLLDNVELVGNLDLVSPSHHTLPVHLLRSHTHGHESQVLGGATRLLKSGRVRNVIIEFDPNLIPSRADALVTLQHLFDARFSCTQLTFSSLTEDEKNSPVYPFFGRVAITNVTAVRFHDFVVRKRKKTDVLCSRR